MTTKNLFLIDKVTQRTGREVETRILMMIIEVGVKAQNQLQIVIENVPVIIIGITKAPAISTTMQTKEERIRILDAPTINGFLIASRMHQSHDR